MMPELKRPVSQVDLERPLESLTIVLKAREWWASTDDLFHAMLDAVACIQEISMMDGFDGTFSMATLRWFLESAMDVVKVPGKTVRLCMDVRMGDLKVDAWLMDEPVKRIGTASVPGRRVYDLPK